MVLEVCRRKKVTVDQSHFVSLLSLFITFQERIADVTGGEKRGTSGRLFFGESFSKYTIMKRFIVIRGATSRYVAGPSLAAHLRTVSHS